jgi:hypothetical protein
VGIGDLAESSRTTKIGGMEKSAVSRNRAGRRKIGGVKLGYSEESGDGSRDVVAHFRQFVAYLLKLCGSQKADLSIQSNDGSI